MQTDRVGAVCVEGLPFGGLVDARVRIRGTLSDIADMAEDVLLAVLRADLAEMRADAAESDFLTSPRFWLN